MKIRAIMSHKMAALKNFFCEITQKSFFNIPTSSPKHLFAIRGKRKRGPGTLQTRDQNLPK